MISVGGTDAVSRTNWTPYIGEWNGSSLVSVGYTGSSTQSFYTNRNGIVSGYGVLQSLTTWGISSPGHGEWWMTLPVQPSSSTPYYQGIGNMDHTTYINRGCHADVELTWQPGTAHAKFILRTNTTSTTLQSRIILATSNWSSYIVQFFGGYGDIRVYFQYEI